MIERLPIMFVSAAALSLLHASPHQAGEDGHHHFAIDFHQVFRQCVDFSTNLPRHGDGIPETEDCPLEQHFIESGYRLRAE